MSKMSEVKVGDKIEDSNGREWVVTSMGEKGGDQTVRGELYWSYASEVIIIRRGN